jgi:exopolysaccharide biosynthesis polyprenyl glycosylphosphotransferase
MLRAHRSLLHRLSVLSDLALIAMAALLGNVVQGLGSFSFAQSTFVVPDPRVDSLDFAGQVCLLLLCWLVFSDRFDFYHSRRTQRVLSSFGSLLETWLVSLGVALVGASLLWGRFAFSAATVFVVALAAITAVKLGTQSALHRIRSRGLNFRRFLVVGDGRGADRIVAESASNQQFGLKPLGYIPFPGHAAPPDGIARIGNYEELRQRITEQLPDCVVVCPPPRATIGEIESVFRSCDEAGIPCQYVPSYLSVRNLHLRTSWWGEVPLLYFAPQPYAPLKHGAKRTIDVVLSGLSLLVLAPVLLLIAAAIKLGDRGPVFHRQVRVGRHGRLFTILKFRTMHVDAESMREQIEHLNEEDGPVFKVRNDPRVTPVGRWLRKYSLDELPQLINVFRGDMSLVGPRPPIPAEVAKYDWWQRRRIAVRPGLTCIWQVFGRNRVPFDRWMEMDLFYVDNWSLWMDFKLMLRTIGVVLRGTGT